MSRRAARRARPARAGQAGWLLAAALGAGCARLDVALDRSAPAAPPAAASAATAPSGPTATTPTNGLATESLRVEIDAPPELKALFERHLDLLRLGRLAPGDVEPAEWSRLVDAAPAQARELLQTEGHFSPRLTLSREPAQPGGPDVVRLHVDPGPQARVGRLVVQARGEIDADAIEQLRARFELQPASGFRNPAWNAAKSAAIARLRAAGYASAAWQHTAAEVDTANNTVTLTLLVDSGPLYRYGSLQIEGLAAQDAATIDHLFGVARGTPVTETLLLDFQDRLQKSGLFDSIAVTLDADPAQAAATRIVVRLSEAPLQTWTFGVGVSANTGPRASVEHRYRRVFGFPLLARNKIEWGQKRQYWDGELTTHARPGLVRDFVGATVENLESDSDTVLSQRVRAGRAHETQRVERLLYAEGERSRRVTTAGSHSQAVAVSLNFHGGWRDLDSLVLPTRGETLALQLGGGHSHGTDAESGPYARAYGRVTGYWPLGAGWYGQARFEAGRVWLPARGVVPDSQRFRAGGDDSVRGYAYRSLGPLVDGAVGGGSALATTSIEVAHALAAGLPTLWGAAFADAGDAADGWSALRPAVGAGVGLRWRSPVGPLRLDYAYGLETHEPRLHFSVGIAF